MATRYIYLNALSAKADTYLLLRVEQPEQTTLAVMLENVTQYEGGWVHAERGVEPAPFGNNGISLLPTDPFKETVEWSDLSINLDHFEQVKLIGYSDVIVHPEEPKPSPWDEEVSGNPGIVEAVSEELIPASDISLQSFIEQIAWEASGISGALNDSSVEELRGVARQAISTHVESAWGKIK